ncbi:MAG: foldase protein PrsA [Bradymonadia bacterium]
MRHTILFLSLLFISHGHARIVDRIVAIVDESVITQSELEDSVKVELARLGQVADQKTRAAKRAVILKRGLDALVGRKLMTQEAGRRSIKIADSDVDQHLQRVKQRQGWDDQKLEMYLTSQGMTLTGFRAAVKENLLEQRVVGVVLGSRIRVTDRDLEDFYKEQRTKMKREFEVEAAHIVLKVATGASVDDEAAVRQRAVDILGRLKAGEAFDALASELSEGPQAKSGGRLGTLRRGNLNPTLEDAIFSIDPGQIDGPYRTPFGYHIIKVLTKRPLPPKSFEQVKGELRNQLRRQKLGAEMEKWVAELKTKAFIELKPLK